MTSPKAALPSPTADHRPPSTLVDVSVLVPAKDEAEKNKADVADKEKKIAELDEKLKVAMEGTKSTSPTDDPRVAMLQTEKAEMEPSSTVARSESSGNAGLRFTGDGSHVGAEVGADVVSHARQQRGAPSGRRSRRRACVCGRIVSYRMMC